MVLRSRVRVLLRVLWGAGVDDGVMTVGGLLGVEPVLLRSRSRLRSLLLWGACGVVDGVITVGVETVPLRSRSRSLVRSVLPDGAMVLGVRVGGVPVRSRRGDVVADGLVLLLPLG